MQTERIDIFKYPDFSFPMFPTRCLIFSISISYFLNFAAESTTTFTYWTCLQSQGSWISIVSVHCYILQKHKNLNFSLNVEYPKQEQGIINMGKQSIELASKTWMHIPSWLVQFLSFAKHPLKYYRNPVWESMFFIYLCNDPGTTGLIYHLKFISLSSFSSIHLS